MTVALVGPTASGKSSLAVALARRYATAGQPAEVVNADSMLVYRGMDIGTAKPSSAERAGVLHHLIDILDLQDTATVADFQTLARATIADCRARGVVPIVVGGSALYLRAIIDQFDFPATDPKVRAALEAELARVGASGMYERLVRADPAAAARIEPANARRVVRALEVWTLTGRPYSASLPERRYALPEVVQIGLDIDRPSLDLRIRARVEAMWATGFVDEVRRLADAGLRDGLTASRALGYRQVLSFLDGSVTEDQALEQTVIGTRKFARRQYSWYRIDDRITWLRYDDPELAARAYALAGPRGAGPAHSV